MYYGSVTGKGFLPRTYAMSKRDLEMKRQKQIWLTLLTLLVISMGAPALAQVERVTADARGIT